MTDSMPTQPLIAVDVVPLAFSAIDGLQVGTAIRAQEPFAGMAALPGVLLGTGESLVAAARRALKTKAGIERGDVRHLTQLGAFDQPGRDPREHAISVAWLAVVTPTVGNNTVWAPVSHLPRHLPFDHDEILARAIEVAGRSLWVDGPLTKALTGDRFPTSTAADIITTLTGTAPHGGNLHRSLTRDLRLERVEGGIPDGRGRPATIWKWLG